MRKAEIRWLIASAALILIPPLASAADKSYFVIPLQQELQVDADKDGWEAGADCDDSNPDVHPNAEWHSTSAGGKVG